MTPAKILRWAKEGRGTGEGPSYRPLLTVHDVPSKGLRVRIWSAKTRRLHHLLSRLEYHFFLPLDCDPDVVDLNEQFPLPLEKTRAIARELGIVHPWDRRTRCTTPMSTDFVYVRIVDGLRFRIARNLKYRRDLAKQRIIEKISIEKAYWDTEAGVDYGIVSEREIDPDLVRNLEWMRDALRPDFLAGIETIIPRVEAFLLPLVHAKDTALADLTDQADRQFGLEPGSSLAIAKWLLAHRYWQVDLTRPISPLAPLVLEGFTDAPAAI